MTTQQQTWFEALTTDRKNSASTLEKPSMRGVQRSVVDKYSDQAHFVYELLQNANDVEATEVHFELKNHGLVFRHNGRTNFSISDPNTEGKDSEKGTLGHVNAITSIANSNKTEASIGKFGVGFKAVFQYTKTPHIYDPNFQFKICRFIVPESLAADFAGRETTETVFWFPFDHDKKSEAESSSDIAEKLKSLVLPVLFLSSLEKISFKVDGISGRYSKRITETTTDNGLTAQLITLCTETNQQTTEDRFWIFTKNSEECARHAYSVGFSLKNGKLTPVRHAAFCFFPTRETTGLNFIIHAPFLLTDSREGIKAGEDWNRKLIQQLAELSADSLLVLRDKLLITDDILKIIPYDEAAYEEDDERTQISFKPFYTTIKKKFQTEQILPASNGEYSSKSRSYWASDTELVALFSDSQLALLTGTEKAQWVFPSIGKKEVQRLDSALAEFIDGGNAHTNRRSNLITQSFDPEMLLRKLTPNFIAHQPQSWLHQLYLYLGERPSYQKLVKQKPIFHDQGGNAVPAYDDKEQPVLFLPDVDITGYVTINQELLKIKTTRDFAEKFGVKKPNLRDEIYNKRFNGNRWGDSNREAYLTYPERTGS